MQSIISTQSTCQRPRIERQFPGGTAFFIIAAALVSQSAGLTANPYGKVQATPLGSTGFTVQEASESRQYLIATFPHLRQVAYLQLPDNVWRALVVGEVTSPKGVAVDAGNRRLFVADPDVGRVWWYSLEVRSNGMLATYGERKIAVQGYAVYWMTCNSVGDLYFTGKYIVEPAASSYDAVFRQDSTNIANGHFLPGRVKELYTRSNTGNPRPKVWMPSGIAVDSFNVFWANQELGKTHCSVCRGPRQNVGKVTDTMVRPLNAAFEEVRGMTSTGTMLFYLTPGGVHGINKGQSGEPIIDPAEGLIAEAPVEDTNSMSFDPKSIAWDGDGTLYFTEATQGMVYSLPAKTMTVHNLTKVVDAPGVYGISMLIYDVPAKSAAVRAQAAVLHRASTCVISFAVAVLGLRLPTIYRAWD